MTKQSPNNEVVREVVDSAKIIWRVREVRVWNNAGKEVNSLLAEHAGGFRKLWSYPGNWAELEDAEVAGLINGPLAPVPSSAVPDAGDTGAGSE